ncbi:MAG TPA: hypothetical protein VGQ39_26520 [Pyrinomonadaceae bacterium]|jgi:hypothetical protein|nr:hypothetical protein [Pyrinomonadaceae bacterium]
MKKPGLKKRRPPGGGAAGRAYQFGTERDTGRDNAEPPTPTDKREDKSGASKKPERKQRVPKKPK